jgi:hypothetical protein
MPVANPDILSADDNYLYMKSQKFNFDGKRQDIEPSSIWLQNQQGKGAHLFSAGGMLDDLGFHRVCMIYGKSRGGAAGSNHSAPKYAPAGRILAVGSDAVYGFSRLPKYHKWTRDLEFHFYAASKTEKKVEIADKKKKKSRGNLGSVNYLWSTPEPKLYANSMVLADQTLFVAGPPAITVSEKSGVEDLLRWQGKKGGLVQALSAEDGKIIAEYQLDVPPVFDGMIAAYNCLYLSLKNGEIICLGE